MIAVGGRGGRQVDAQAPLEHRDEQGETIDAGKTKEHVPQSSAAGTCAGGGDRDDTQLAKQDEVVQAGRGIGRPGQRDHKPAKPGREEA